MTFSIQKKNIYENSTDNYPNNQDFISNIHLLSNEIFISVNDCFISYIQCVTAYENNINEEFEIHVLNYDNNSSNIVFKGKLVDDGDNNGESNVYKYIKLITLNIKIKKGDLITVKSQKGISFIIFFNKTVVSSIINMEKKIDITNEPQSQTMFLRGNIPSILDDIFN